MSEDICGTLTMQWNFISFYIKQRDFFFSNTTVGLVSHFVCIYWYCIENTESCNLCFDIKIIFFLNVVNHSIRPDITFYNHILKVLQNKAP